MKQIHVPMCLNLNSIQSTCQINSCNQYYPFLITYISLVIIILLSKILTSLKEEIKCLGFFYCKENDLIYIDNIFPQNKLNRCQLAIFRFRDTTQLHFQDVSLHQADTGIPLFGKNNCYKNILFYFQSK